MDDTSTISLTGAEEYHILSAVVQCRRELERSAARLRALSAEHVMTDDALTGYVRLEERLRAEFGIPAPDPVTAAKAQEDADWPAPRSLEDVMGPPHFVRVRAVGESESMDRELAGGR